MSCGSQGSQAFTKPSHVAAALAFATAHHPSRAAGLAIANQHEMRAVTNKHTSKSDDSQGL
jgi:hypothetical protein